MYLRWALIEAAIHAWRHPLYKPAYDRSKAGLGGSRGGKVVRVELGRKLAEAIWHTRRGDMAHAHQGERFAPARSQTDAPVA